MSSACATPSLTTLTARIDGMDIIQDTFRTYKVLTPSYWENLAQRSPGLNVIGERLKAKYNNVDPRRVSTPHDALALAAQDLCKVMSKFSMPPTSLEVHAYVCGLLEPPF